MRIRLDDKRWGLVLVFLALVSLVLLASALKTMDFRPAQPIGSAYSNVKSIDLPRVAALLKGAAEIRSWRHIAFWGGLFVMVLLISSLFSPELRKRLIRILLRIAAFAIIFSYVIKNNPNVLAILFLQLPSFGGSVKDLPGSKIAPPVFHPPQIPPYLSFLAAFGVTVMTIACLWVIYRWWEKQKSFFPGHQPLKEIADIARLSLKDIRTGKDSNDAIIKCYDRMSEIVNVKRSLQREYAMTPTEFASRLEKAGLPREPVTRLTNLFESVRYGGYISTPTRINEAEACLISILDYCRDT